MVRDFLHCLQVQIQPARRAANLLDELAGYIVSEQDHVAHGNLSLPHEDAVCAEKSIVPERELFFLRGLFVGFPQTPLAHAIYLTALAVAQNQTSKRGSLQQPSKQSTRPCLISWCFFS